MEMYRQILALLEQADASNVIAALALVVATLSLLSSRQTSRRAVALAQQTIDLRGHLAGASLRIGREHWTVRVVNGTDPTVLDRVVLYIESREKPFPPHRASVGAVDDEPVLPARCHRPPSAGKPDAV